MRRTFVLLLFFLVMAQGFAQDSEITDDQLKTYAIMNLAVQSITSTISPLVSEMIADQNDKIENPDDKITNARWKELTETDGDPAKLAAIDAKEWEKQFLNVVTQQIQKKKDAATTVLKTMASNALGASKYREIKTALSADPELKQRYSEIVSRCQ